ncbi:unnamed protein product, partial [Adineta steineri]
MGPGLKIFYCTGSGPGPKKCGSDGLYWRPLETNEQRLQIIKDETNQLTKQIKQQNHVISSKENQIDLYTKELVNLEDCLSTTQEELENQQSKVNESKTKVKILTQKMHRLSTDEKPLIKDIVHYQK